MTANGKKRIALNTEARFQQFLQQNCCRDFGENIWEPRGKNEDGIVEDFILKHGQFYKWKQVPGIDLPAMEDTPPHIRPLPNGWCQPNALHLVMVDARLTYVEGYANLGGEILAPHAWTVDQNGMVIDPTWGMWERWACGAVAARKRFYFGVPFKGRWLMTIRDGTLGWNVAHWTGIVEQFSTFAELQGDPMVWRGRPGVVRNPEDNVTFLISTESSRLYCGIQACLWKIARMGVWHGTRAELRNLLWKQASVPAQYTHRSSRASNDMNRYIERVRKGLCPLGVEIEKTDGGWIVRRGFSRPKCGLHWEVMKAY